MKTWTVGGLLVSGIVATVGLRMVPQMTGDFLHGSRRQIFQHCGLVVLAGVTHKPDPAQARGIVRFPPLEPLSNRYFFLRAGESISDAEDLVATNPIDKLQLDDGLTPKGKLQAEAAAETLRSMGVENPMIWFSTWSKSQQTADILGDALLVGRDRRMPEYSYLDARGVGEFEATSIKFTAKHLELIDQRDAAENPPATFDGTPNESVQNVATRCQQMVSIMETLSTGADILVVAADSHVLSIWQAAIAGVPLEGHGAFAYGPGELRQLEYSMPGDLNDQNEADLVFAADGVGADLAKRVKDAEARAEAGKVRVAKMGVAGLEKERKELETQLINMKQIADDQELKEYNDELESLRLAKVARQRKDALNHPWTAAEKERRSTSGAPGKDMQARPGSSGRLGTAQASDSREKRGNFNGQSLQGSQGSTESPSFPNVFREYPVALAVGTYAAGSLAAHVKNKQAEYVYFGTNEKRAVADVASGEHEAGAEDGVGVSESLDELLLQEPLGSDFDRAVAAINSELSSASLDVEEMARMLEDEVGEDESQLGWAEGDFQDDDGWLREVAATLAEESQ